MNEEKNKTGSDTNRKNRVKKPRQPRQFVGDNRLKYSKNHKKRFIYKLKRRFKTFWPITLLLIGLIVFAILYFSGTFIKEDSIDSTFQELSYRNLDLLDEKVPISEFIRANGGTKVIDNIRTIRLEGEVVSKDEIIEFYSIRKRPDKMLFEMHYPNYDVTHGSDSEVVWRKLDIRGRKPEIKVLNDDEAKQAIGDGKFFTPFYQFAIEREGKLISIQNSYYEGTKCVVVEFEQSDGSVISKAYIDSNSLYLLARMDYKDSDEHLTIFSDYRDISGFMLPFKTITKKDGIEINQIILTKVAINHGVLSSIFSVPEA